MSQQTVEQIIGRLVLDKDFRAQLTVDRATALAAFDLTDDERTNLANMDLQEFNTAVAELDQRVSKLGTFTVGN